MSDREVEEHLAGSTSEVPEDLTGQPRRVLVGSVVLRRTFSALRHRNFRLFFFGQLVSLMGTWMQNTALSWLVYQLTGSKLLLGVVSAAGSAPMLFLSPYGGSLADRHPKRTVLLWTQGSMMLLACVMCGLSFGRVLNPPGIILLATLVGVAMAFDMPARQSFLVEITSRADLMNAISLNSAIVNGARVVGPAVAGIVMARTSASFCFLLNAVSFFAVIGGLLRMRLQPLPQHTGKRTHGHLREGFRYVLQTRRLRVIFTLFAVVGIFGWSYSILMPALATDVLHLRERGFGTLLAANGLGALAGALTTAAFGGSFSPRRMAFTGLYTFSIMLSVGASFPKYPIVLICLACGGWGMMLFFSTINTVIQTSVPDAMRGRIMGIWALVFGGMTPLGSLQAGTISQHLGVLATIKIGAAVCALAGVVTWLATRKAPLTPRSPPQN